MSSASHLAPWSVVASCVALLGCGSRVVVPTSEADAGSPLVDRATPTVDVPGTPDAGAPPPPVDVPSTTPVDVPPTTPVDVSVPSACPPPVTDPARDTSCSAPAPVDGRVPYFQCTSDVVCPRERFANNPARPGFRVTYLRITAPAALGSAAFLSVINPTLAHGTALWGITVDTATGTLRTGGMYPVYTRGSVGVGLMDGRFSIQNGTGPALTPLVSPFSVVDGLLTTTRPDAWMQLPLFDDDTGARLIDSLPLEHARVTLRLTADRGCVGGAIPSGGRYTETTSRWVTEDGCGNPYGTIDADMALDFVRERQVTIGGTSIPLCNVISGANCATDPQAGWPRQPDATTPDGRPAYHLRASFAAISADIYP